MNIMNLKNQLHEDMKTALRGQDKLSLSTIRLANAAIKQFEVDERSEADDAQVRSILTKMIKQRKDSARIYAEAGRTDLAERENAEITVLMRYMPVMMSADAIQAAVTAAITDTGAAGMADMGKVMGALKTQLAGQADMAEISKILKTALSH